MNPQAYNILNGLGLRIPQRYELGAVLSSSPEDRFFVRFDSSSGELSRLMLGADIQSSSRTLQKLANDGSLLYIEEVLMPLLGGVSLCRPSFAYSELVWKHPVTLLRRGLCGARALQSGSDTFVQPVFQGWTAELTESYDWQPSRGPRDGDLTWAVKSLGECLPMHTQTPLLVEWMYTTSGFVFCDARNDGLQEFGENLFQLRKTKEILVQGVTTLPKEDRQVDGFDVDHRNPPQDHSMITACNGALLSHYSTRCRQRPVTVTLMPCGGIAR